MYPVEFGSRETARIIKPLYRYYGSCGREHCVPSTSFITQRWDEVSASPFKVMSLILNKVYLMLWFSSLSASTPLLNGSRPLRAGKCIDARIFTLGVLFIGGLTVGSYLLYQNGMHTNKVDATKFVKMIHNLLFRPSVADYNNVWFRESRRLGSFKFADWSSTGQRQCGSSACTAHRNQYLPWFNRL